jgi:hypothetical protein
MTTYGITSFESDINKGKTGEEIFISDFLEFLHVQYVNVTMSQGYQVIDADMKTAAGLYEIKNNYKDDKQIIIEEYTNYNQAFGVISMGWFYKSKANMLVFLSKDTRAMILIPFTPEFKAHYEIIKEQYTLIPNKISFKGDRKWQSAFRKIPLTAINGYFAYYKKVEGK